MNNKVAKFLVSWIIITGQIIVKDVLYNDGKNTIGMNDLVDETLCVCSL